MKCERIRELVSDALDGALTGSVADRFHAHLDACPPCRTYHAELKESLLLLEELPSIEVGEEFDRAVWARIRREEEPASLVASLSERLEMLRVRFSFGTGLWRWSPAVAAAALLVAFAIQPPPTSRKAEEVATVADRTADNAGRAADGVRRTSAPAGPSELGGTEVPVVAMSTRESVSRNPEDGADVEEAADYPSGMPHAVASFVAGRDLRLTNTDSYERSNYNYPLRHIPDPFQVQHFVRFSPRQRAPGAGTAVGATVPHRDATPDAAVAVFEF
ncbi:zf-HC2 domain-containing protein [bacterium]|nr:zf-HC2 domain-containing protein [bacterium]